MLIISATLSQYSELGARYLSPSLPLVVILLTVGIERYLSKRQAE